MQNDNLKVVLKGTDLYFSEEVNQESALLTCTLLQEAEETVLLNHIRYGTPLHVTMHINSYGGEADSMFAIVSAMDLLRVPVHTVINGAACSAASVIALAGEKRYITEYSTIMIHTGRQWQGWTTWEEAKDNKHIFKLFYKQLVKYYVDHTDLSKKQVKKRLKHDWWMTAKQALKDGFVDEVLK